MKRLVLRAAAAFAAAFLLSGIAHAQLFRAYVSSAGSDLNPCTLPQPCRLLPAALAAVAAGGEIWILDSANFNTSTVNVAKDVSILAVPGQVGSILALAGAPAMSVGAGFNVRLRNVVIVSSVTSPGTDGVVVNPGVALFVEGSTIAVPQRGIAAANATVSVSDTTFRDGQDGIYAAGSTVVDVWRARFAGFKNAGIEGIAPGSGFTLRLAVSESSFTASGVGLLIANANEGSTARATVVRSSFTNGPIGVMAQAVQSSAIVSLAENMFSNMTTSATSTTGGGFIETLSNNTARNNTATGAATPVSAF